jgi:Cu-processing system permease protein
MRNTTSKIARYQLRDVLRSRWILFYGLFFLVLTDALFRFGGSGERVLLSLMNAVLIAVPLVSVLLGAMYVYASREFTELLLSQPVRRRSLFMGLFLGLALPLAGAFVLGTGLPFLWHGAVESAGPVALLIGTGTLLTLIFSSLAFLVALRAEDRIKGLGLCLALWLFFTVIFDGVVLLAMHMFAAYPLEHPVIALSMLNPVDLGRILLLLNFEISALLGFTGAVFQRFFGSAAGQILTIGALMTWLAVPFALGLRAFARKDF